MKFVYADLNAYSDLLQRLRKQRALTHIIMK